MPPAYAAEMVPFDPLVGEFRVHYAGFFDPGFGYSQAGGTGSRAVLEVRSREVPFLLGHGQTIGRLIYERLSEPPDRLYGTGARLQLPGADPQALQSTSALRAVSVGGPSPRLDAPILLPQKFAGRGCSSMVEQQLPKLNTRVRFPSPAPARQGIGSAAARSLRFP